MTNMLVLTIRTDKPDAELALFEGDKQLERMTWQAHKKLADTIHAKIGELLESQKRTLSDLNGVAVYKGPGSFTGLRIGISVANALADGLTIPIVGDSGENWHTEAIERLLKGEDEHLVQPEYGAPPHVTAPKR